MNALSFSQSCNKTLLAVEQGQFFSSKIMLENILTPNMLQLLCLVAFNEFVLRVVSFLGRCFLIVVFVPAYLGSFCQGHLLTSSQEKIS